VLGIKPVFTEKHSRQNFSIKTEMRQALLRKQALPVVFGGCDGIIREHQSADKKWQLMGRLPWGA